MCFFPLASRKKSNETPCAKKIDTFLLVVLMRENHLWQPSPYASYRSPEESSSVSWTEPPCRLGPSGLSVAPYRLPFVLSSWRSKSAMLAGGLSNLPITLGEFSGSRGGEGGECSGKGLQRGTRSQMVDFHVWDVVAVEDLRDFIAEGMSSSLGPLNFVCVFFLNLWQHRTDCDPRMHL